MALVFTVAISGVLLLLYYKYKSTLSPHDPISVVECHDSSLPEHDHIWCHLKPDTYNCTFPAMIDDWRAKWYEGSHKNTNEMFPFGFVQVRNILHCE